MDIRDHIIQRPLTSRQAAQGVAIMERQNKAQAEKALRERVDLGNLQFYVMYGDLRK
jgi:hypothetical protein